MYVRKYCEKSHDLNNISGETLISDGVTLDCKEQLGYSNKL